jgi:hypothetical protein
MYETKKSYVLGFIFDHEMKEILLINRTNEPYKDKINFF